MLKSSLPYLSNVLTFIARAELIQFIAVELGSNAQRQTFMIYKVVVDGKVEVENVKSNFYDVDNYSKIS